VESRQLQTATWWIQPRRVQCAGKTARYRRQYARGEFATCYGVEPLSGTMRFMRHASQTAKSARGT